MTRYKALLVAPDGDYVTDYHGSRSIDEVWVQLAAMGSRWFFYPIRFVVVDKKQARLKADWRPYVTRSRYAPAVPPEPPGYLGYQRIVDAPEAFDHLIGKRVNTALQFIRSNPMAVEALLS